MIIRDYDNRDHGPRPTRTGRRGKYEALRPHLENMLPRGSSVLEYETTIPSLRKKWLQRLINYIHKTYKGKFSVYTISEGLLVERRGVV